MEGTKVTITLELRPDGDLLEGHATDGSGNTRVFTGWLGLIAAIDAFLDAPARTKEDSDVSR